MHRKFLFALSKKIYKQIKLINQASFKRQEKKLKESGGDNIHRYLTLDLHGTVPCIFTKNVQTLNYQPFLKSG
jgi:hypothetical protein